ncbi:hypothetical protein [Bradyrhizobium liaoningense]|uniref:hypothetical protein n=1 Tax=Bradyrhizobium liaoningense TaxID=43992 RepID=UPI001BA90F33|nr:hypothetical protein [Bradyrhizobium liaoningense]MBR0907025.1 hypothetical protein [Bradyrhizobium liaoningense]
MTTTPIALTFGGSSTPTPVLAGATIVSDLVDHSGSFSLSSGDTIVVAFDLPSDGSENSTGFSTGNSNVSTWFKAGTTASQQSPTGGTLSSNVDYAVSLIETNDPAGGTAALVSVSAIRTAAKASSAGRTPLQGKWLLTTSLKPNLSLAAPPSTTPTLISSMPTAFNTTTTPKAAGSIIVLSGDILVAHAMKESAVSGAIDISTTSGSTSAWTLLEEQPGTLDSGRAYLRTWWATATANSTVSVTFASSGAAQLFGGIVKVYRNAVGIGAAESTNNANGSGAPSVSITATQSSSVLDYASVDWSAITGTASFVSSTGTPTVDVDTTVSGGYRVYSSHVDAGISGAKTIGVSAPNTQRFVASTVEILGSVNAASLTARVAVAAGAIASALGRTPLASKAAVGLTAQGLSTGRTALSGATKATSSVGLVRSVQLAFQTRFFPAMRGTLTTRVSLGSAASATARFKASGATTRTAAMAGRAVAAARAKAGSGAFAAMLGRVSTAVRANSTFSGTVILAIQTRFFPAMRGALNAAAVPTAIALEATSAVVSRVRATIAGRTSLTAQTSIMSQAPARISAIASLATRSATQVRSAAAVVAKSTLSAAGSLRAAGRGTMIGTVALATRTASTFAGAATLPGQVVELLARATTAVKTTAGVVARTSLSAKTALQVTGSTPPAALQAFLAAVTKTRTAIYAATVASASLATSGAVKIGTIARGALSGTVELASRAKASAASKGKAANPVAGRAMVRASARALLVVLRPVIPTPVQPRPGRLGRLRASLERAFGEEFDIEPMTSGVDVNARVMPDISRDPKLNVTGIWMGPTTSRVPSARGSIADDKAHNWNVSLPSVRFDDAAIAGTRKGDRITRQLDRSVWYIERIVPDGFGRTTVQLTARKRITQ